MKKNVLSGITAMLCSLLCLPNIHTAVPCAFAAEETAYTTTFPTQTTACTSVTTTTTSAEYLTKGTIPLTIDDVIALSKKGNALGWEDFKDYISTDIGSGLYIDKYDLEDGYTLLIGGVPPQAPIYMKLFRFDDTKNGIDIRTDDVEAFLGGRAIMAAVPVSSAVSEIAATSVNLSENAKGDVNCDGSKTVSDAILLSRIVAEDITVSVTEEGMKHADLNDSGSPDQDDIVLLLRLIAGIK